MQKNRRRGCGKEWQRFELLMANCGFRIDTCRATRHSEKKPVEDRSKHADNSVIDDAALRTPWCFNAVHDSQFAIRNPQSVNGA